MEKLKYKYLETEVVDQVVTGQKVSVDM